MNSAAIIGKGSSTHWFYTGMLLSVISVFRYLKGVFFKYEKGVKLHEFTKPVGFCAKSLYVDHCSAAVVGKKNTLMKN